MRIAGTAPGEQGFLVCTIITKNFLAHARALAYSLRETNPESMLLVLLADRVADSFDPAAEPFQLLQLCELRDQEAIARMAFYYTAFEFCNALRGELHDYLWHHTLLKKWLYIDADVMVTGSLADIARDLSSCSILLSPHCRSPVDIEHADPHELNFLRTGIYNSGVLGLRRTETTRRFLDWFQSRLRRFSFDDMAGHGKRRRGLFVDQLWLNLVPLYFSDVGLLEDPGANLAHWNLHERELTEGPGGEILVNGSPLRFVHFSGWNIEQPEAVSRYALHFRGEGPQSWRRLGRRYRELLLSSGYEDTRGLPYSFNRFDTGEAISHAARRAYYREQLSRSVAAPDPFADPSRFPGRSLVSRLLSGLKRLACFASRQPRESASDEYESRTSTLLGRATRRRSPRDCGGP